MLTVTRFKGEMLRRQKAYDGPNDDVCANLANTDAVILMGPSGVGKNEQKSRFIQAATASGKLAVAEVQSITSRPRRKEEIGKAGLDPYRKHYNLRNPKAQDGIINLFEEGRLVQASIHPHSGHLYGTLDEEYKASPPGEKRIINLADFMATEYLEVAQKDIFRSFLGIYLAAEDNEQWLDMWASRGDGMGSLQDVQQRLAEGHKSTGVCVTDEAIATQGLYHVAIDYSDAVMPATGLTRTTGAILSIVNQDGTHDNAPGLAATQAMHDYIGTLQRGVQIGAQARVA